MSQQGKSGKTEGCALCGAEAKLCKSHIIPEFCYAPMYDSEHRFIDMYDVKNQKIRKGQKGHWQYMLCRECESHFSKFERHASRVFTRPLPAPRLGTTRYFDLPAVDPGKLRLFLLSVLWRAGVSRLDMFEHVVLGRHEEALRRIVLSEEPPSFDSYGTMMFALHYRKDPLHNMLVEPTPCRVDGHRVYRFVFHGFVMMIWVTGHRVGSRWRRLFLGADGATTVYSAELDEFKFLHSLWYGGK